MEKRDLEELESVIQLQKETNEKLKTSMKAFQIAAEESGSLVFTYDTRKQTIFVDERTAKAFGVSTVQEGVPYDMVKQGVVSEDTKDTYIRIHEKMIGGSKEASGMVKLVQADGSSAVYELKFRAILSDEGEVTGTAVGIYRDVTERFIREREREQYQLALSSTEMYMFQYDTEKDILAVFAASRGKGGKQRQYKYEHFFETVKEGRICPAEDIPAVLDFFRNGAQRPVQLQMFDRETGQLRWYSYTGSAMQENGNVRSIFGSFSDITDVKTKEFAYRKLERVLKGIQEEYIGIYEVDLLHNEYTILSSSTDQVYELPEQGKYTEFVEKAVAYLVAPEYREEFQRFADVENLRWVLNQEHRVEYEFRTVAKKRAWQRSVFLAVEYADGVPSKVILYQTDIDSQKTERLAQQQAITEAYRYAEEANAAKTTFFSRMSHDIRTPMNAIIGMTAIAGAHVENPQRVKECLSKITGAARHLLGLVNEVLDMSKIESGSIELQEEAFNLADLIDSMVSLVLPQIKECGHRLSVNIGNLIHEQVIGDSLRIQQAFVNLISNAVKYTPDGGTIQVTIKEKPVHGSNYGEYEFCFEDNGIGMSEEFQKVIFEPFTRAEDSRLNKIPGTGLGMAITRNLIRMMDGDIRVESRLNEGSRFIVTIHLKLQDEKWQDTDILQDLPVLVVDDEVEACESTCLILNSIGMKGEWSQSGRRAVEMVVERRARAEDYFAVILDWKMPDMDGICTAREIRRQVGPDIPIIFLTAYDWSEIEEEARAAGVDKFLVKPLFKSRLLTSFREILSPESNEEETTGEIAEMPMGELKLSGRRILLAEDNGLNAEIAIEIFRMIGVTTEWAQNGKEAVEMVEESEEGYYQMVFMDIQMPVMDGYRATAAIRSLDRSDVKKLPIVAMTANAFVEDVNQAARAGMNGHISKPIDFRHLAEIMKKYLH